MSEREWKPGDVAIVHWPICADGPLPAVRGQGRWHLLDQVAREWSDPEYLTDAWLEKLDGRIVRPLVVIDPEDAEQVRRLHLLVMHQKEALEGRITRGALTFDTTAAALREFANPTPPRPDEPQGLGAVVEDAQGRRWTRIARDHTPWCLGEHFPQRWRDLDAVRVLSPGVEVSP